MFEELFVQDMLTSPTILRYRQQILFKGMDRNTLYNKIKHI